MTVNVVVPLLAAVASLVAAPSAQRPPLTGEHILLEIVCVDAGKQVPRLRNAKKAGKGAAHEPAQGPPADDADKEPAVPFTVVGQKLAWRVGPKPLEDLRALTIELKRILDDRSTWREAEDQPGMTVPLPVLIRPDDKARWRDVAEVIDVVLSTGFRDFDLAVDGGPVWPWLVFKGVADPVRDRGAHVVPKVVYSEPDEPDETWRPVVYVAQDGGSECRGEGAFRLHKDASDAAVKKVFEQLAATAREKQGSRKFGPLDTELLHARLLVHADVWTEWRHVRRVIQAALRTKPAFWKLEYAAAEYDYEERMRKGERF